MNYEFPIIRHIDDVLPALAGAPEFIVADKGNYQVINYMVSTPDTFPPIKSAGGNAKQRAERALHNALRRECRGLIFDMNGKLISRRYHKFFNLNERLETMQDKIDLTKPHILLEKLDGSMISPIMINGIIRWTTKMGITDTALQAEDYVAWHSAYHDIALDLLQNNMTPIFEWCSNKNKIVLSYPEDKLVLTAIRLNETGQYLSYDYIQKYSQFNGIPYVPKLDVSIDQLASMEDIEGIVIRFDDGHMIKVKTEWYVLRHKSKDAIMREKNVLEYIIKDTVDDVLPYLTEADATRLKDFQKTINEWLIYHAKALQMRYNELWKEANYDRKTFALNLMQGKDSVNKQLLFKIADGHDPFEAVRNYVGLNIGTRDKIEAIRPILGMEKWEYLP